MYQHQLYGDSLKTIRGVYEGDRHGSTVFLQTWNRCDWKRIYEPVDNIVVGESQSSRLRLSSHRCFHPGPYCFTFSPTSMEFLSAIATLQRFPLRSKQRERLVHQGSAMRQQHHRRLCCTLGYVLPATGFSLSTECGVLVLWNWRVNDSSTRRVLLASDVCCISNTHNRFFCAHLMHACHMFFERTRFTS